MDFVLKFWLNILWIFLHQKFSARAALYVFLIEDPEIFQDCKNVAGYLGVADMLDFSNLKIEFVDDAVHIEGSFTMQWDADPNDRVEMRTEVLKYERGSWQPTIFTMIHKDFCRSMFDHNDIWYQTWARFVYADDLKCITNKGHTYHHQPFDLETVFSVQGLDFSGKHKVVIKIDAFNRNNKKQPYSVCLEVVGDILKK